MLVPDNIYNRIDDIIERSYTNFTYQLLGNEFLTPEQQLKVEALGLLVGRRPLLELLYLLVKQRSEERYQTDQTLQELLDSIFVTGVFNQLPQRAQSTINNAMYSLDNIIEKNKAEAKARIKKEIISANKDFTAWVDKPEPPTIEQIYKKRESGINALMIAVGAVLLGVNRAFHKEFTGELTDFVNKTVTDVSKDLPKNEQLVYKTVMHNRCDWCGKAYTQSNGEPIIYKLSTLIANGTNDGKPKSQWLPVVGPHHPRCFTGSQLLFTEEGIHSFEFLANLEHKMSLGVVVDNRIKISSKTHRAKIDRHSQGARIKKASTVFDTGIRECLRITLASGHTIEVSKDHEMWVDDNNIGYKTEAKNLKIGDKIPLLSGSVDMVNEMQSFPNEAELMGNLLGDGELNSTAKWWFFGNDIPYGKFLYKKAQKLLNRDDSFKIKIYDPDDKYTVPRFSFNSLLLKDLFINKFGLSKKPRRIPKDIFKSDKVTMCSFLRGLFSADGHVEHNNKCSIVLAQNDLAFLKEVQILLSFLGYVSRIYDHGEDHEKVITYANGDKHLTKRKKAWRLVIGGTKQGIKFKSEIGFGEGLTFKNNNLEKAINNSGQKSNWRTARVSKIENIGLKQTYCLNEPETNTVTVNGIVTGQCRCQLHIYKKSVDKNSQV